jgi:hypothetical protein
MLYGCSSVCPKRASSHFKHVVRPYISRKHATVIEHVPQTYNHFNHKKPLFIYESTFSDTVAIIALAMISHDPSSFDCLSQEFAKSGTSSSFIHVFIKRLRVELMWIQSKQRNKDLESSLRASRARAAPSGCPQGGVSQRPVSQGPGCKP